MMKSVGPLALLGIITIIIIVAVGAYVWLAFSRYVHLGSSQTHKVLSANQTGTVSQVIGNMTEGFNTSQFDVGYSGTATVSIDGIQLTLPVNVGVARYYNDSRAQMAIEDIPLIGNVSAIQIRNGSAYYSCISGANSSKKGYQCSAQGESNTVFNVFSLAANDSVAGGLGSTTMHFGAVNQSSYNGMPCTNREGYFNYTNSTGLSNLNISSEIGQGIGIGNVSFLSCVSNQDRIPLTIYVYVTAKTGNTVTSAALQLGETDFSRSSSSAITALPGPTMNQTG
jgi:hypothetical protein